VFKKPCGEEDRPVADQLAEDAPGLIEPLADLEEAEDYAEGRKRELAFGCAE